ncbi:hypothetical protein O1L68_42635 [Streptomyces lydicus]|nr:hypothetical protein [Streptomyces lydicus]
MWDYNTNPHGGKAKKAAAQAAQAEENKKYNPDYGMHVSIRHSSSYTLCFTKV